MRVLLNKYILTPSFSGKYKEKSEDTEFSALYFNDWHGKKETAKLAGLASAADSFIKEKKDGFILCAGDTLIGGEKELSPKKKFLVKFLNYMSEIAKNGSEKAEGLISVSGNHELDSGEKGLAEALEKANFKIVATNLHLKEDSPLKEQENKTLFKSIIAEKNGHYYGFIGTLPVDIKQRVSGIDFLNKMNLGTFDRRSIKTQRKIAGLLTKGVDKEFVDKKEKKLDEKLLKDTIKQIQKEIDKLTAEGVNKIVLISHLANSRDKKVAQSTTGIDVIIGGHSHEVIDGVQQGINLLSNKAGEPVIITQAGQNGDYFGNLSLIFDEKGIIKPETIKNQIQRTQKQPLSLEIVKDIKNMKEEFFGKPEKLNEIDHDFIPQNPDTEENPLSNILMDSMKQKIVKENPELPEPEFVFRNASTVRGGLKASEITTENIEEVLPFESKPTMVMISEKNIFSALQHGIDTIQQRPELLQVSGVKYSIKDGKVTDAYFVDDENKIKSKIDPDSDKEHVVVTDRYLLNGGINYNMLKVPESKIIKDFDWVIQVAMKEHIKSLSKEELQEKLKPQGRITFTGKSSARQNQVFVSAA